MQGKGGGCDLKICNLLYRNSMTKLFLDISQNFQNTFKKSATPINGEFLGISGRASFWNIAIYV